MSLSLSRIISVIAFWGGEGDRFWDVGGAIAFGVWEGDRFWGCRSAIAFGVWEGDRCLGICDRL
ncbi:MAG: hypothetical protein PT118_25305 [Aphanizomenon gracile PMC644.10]|nr:hypothetical protein [Aphanizomenon gracile PMC644.10]